VSEQARAGRANVEDGPGSETGAERPKVRGQYFDKQYLGIAPGEILAFLRVRNERDRLPFLLDYHRRLGVDRFVVVDNGSTDGTEAWLAGQPDVALFQTEASFAGAASGVLTVEELADHYGTGHWTLTLDADELFTYPGAEAMGLRALCDWLEAEGTEAVFCVFLDMYSDRPLGQTRAAPGADWRPLCPWFETASYRLAPLPHPPFLQITGGPRGRLFDGGTGLPVMQKVPLVHRRSGFSHFFSTHALRHVPFSQLTGAVLHYRFFAAAAAQARSEAARGDRRTPEHYATYGRKMTEDLCFHSERSQRYGAPRDLVAQGVMAAPPAYRAHLAESRGAAEAGHLLPDPATEDGPMSLRSIAALWPFLANPGIAQHFRRAPDAGQLGAQAYLRRARSRVAVAEIAADGLRLIVPEPIQHLGVPARLALALFAGDRLIATRAIDGSDPAVTIDPDTLVANTFHVPLAVAEAGAQADLRLCLYDPRLTPDPAAAPPEALGPPLYAGPWQAVPAPARRSAGLDGVAGRLQDGVLHGWLHDTAADRFDRAVTAWIDGRLAAHGRPRIARADLGPGALGFALPLPLGALDARGSAPRRVELRAAGANLILRRTPFTLPAGQRDLRWDAKAGTWVAP